MCEPKHVPVCVLHFLCCASISLRGVRQVRAAACLALGAWGDLAGSACTPVAQVLVARSVPRVLAAEALAQMGPEGEECLRQLVHEEEVGEMAARHACPMFPHVHFV